MEWNEVEWNGMNGINGMNEWNGMRMEWNRME